MTTLLEAPSKPRQFIADPITVLKETCQQLQAAEKLRLAREFDQAESICLALVESYPDYYGALHTLGLIYADKEKHHRAIHYLSHAAMYSPGSWTTLTALAGEYLNVGAQEMAIRCLTEALKINAEQAAIFVTLGEIYLNQREYGDAYGAFTKAIKLDRSMPEAVTGYADACLHLGRYAEASDAIHRLMDTEPANLEMLRLITSLPSSYIRRDILADLDLALKAEEDSERDQVAAGFIRAAALDKAGCYREAWESAVEANAKVAVRVANDIEVELQQVEHRVNWFRDNLKRLSPCQPQNTEFPMSLFVMGPSRSGKTTAESIIGSQPEVRRGYESSAISKATTTAFQTGGLIGMKSLAHLPLQLHPVAQRIYRDNISGLMRDKSVFTSTSPGYIWEVPFFFSSMPNTRFVFVRRNLDDLSIRIFMKHYSRDTNVYSYDFRALTRYVELYYELIDLFAEAFPAYCRIIKYEDMVLNPSAALREMCVLCNLAPDTALLPYVADDRGCGEPYLEMIRSVS